MTPDSKDYLFRAPNTETRDPTRDSSLHTACESTGLGGRGGSSASALTGGGKTFVVGKNYRLQDIQL
jgi:hypothetical protein